MLKKMVRPDAKGRVTLGRLAEGVSSFLVTEDKGKLILEPYTEIPATEKWLFENPVALKKIRRGLKEANAKRLSDLGSFADYATDDAS